MLPPLFTPNPLFLATNNHHHARRSLAQVRAPYSVTATEDALRHSLDETGCITETTDCEMITIMFWNYKGSIGHQVDTKSYPFI